MNKTEPHDLLTLYNILLNHYGRQGWWTVLSEGGYQPGRFDHPTTDIGRFEVIVGAILTQNTSWSNVKLSLAALAARGIDSPSSLLAAQDDLPEIIRSSGYFNQKAKKLIITARFLLDHGWPTETVPTRAELLALWGIGDETADDILLYAYHQPIFVVDAYTRRIFSRVGLVSSDASYLDVQDAVHRHVPQDLVVFKEYHGLIVRHAKEFCRKTPKCSGCPLEERCSFAGST